MTNDPKTTPHKEVEPHTGHYESFLNLLPLPDLRVELEDLDEQRDEGSLPPFSVHRTIRSDLAFRCILRRQIEEPSNSSAEANATKGAMLPEVQLLRAVATLLDLQELEYRIRSRAAKLEKLNDPDVSALQNLISELVSRAKSCGEGVQH